MIQLLETNETTKLFDLDEYFDNTNEKMTFQARQTLKGYYFDLLLCKGDFNLFKAKIKKDNFHNYRSKDVKYKMEIVKNIYNQTIKIMKSKSKKINVVYNFRMTEPELINWLRSQKNKSKYIRNLIEQDRLNNKNKINNERVL